MREFLAHLSIQVIRQEGDNQLLCICPKCEKKKFYINITTGQYKCQSGSCQFKGNPWTLTKDLIGLQPGEIAKLLKKFGLESGTSKLLEAPKQAPVSHIRLGAKECVEMSSEEVKTFCKLYGLQEPALRTVMGKVLWRHAKEPWALLPSHYPGVAKSMGIMRVHLNRELIKTAHGDEKYPQVYGSVHGLFGLRAIEKDKPKDILFTEGWRDAIAATAAGYNATASSGGASCWKDEWLPAFKDKNVTIIMDADKAGVKAANRAAGRIVNVALSCNITHLPYEIKDDHGQDLYDWLKYE